VEPGDGLAAAATEENSVNRNVPDDLKDLVWTDEEAAAATKAAGEGTTTKAPAVPTKAWRRKPGYITLPADWVEALKRATPHPPWGVALYLVQRFIRERDKHGKKLRTLVVSNGNLEAWQIGREAKTRDLQMLEAVGLIEVELRGAGQSPRVTWLVNPEG
jgi:hypothetical protein